MFCSKCGSPVNEGEKFCSVCGQQTETAGMQQTVDQPVAEQPYGQQPYGQQPYNNGYDNAPKKSKKGLWVALSLVAVLAIAAVLIFVVFANNQPTISQSELPFEGNTPQTQFANNTVRVFSDAFAGLGSDTSSFEEIADKPFDMTMDMTAGIMGQKFIVSLDAAYDNETLGFNINAMGTSVKMALLEDVLYMDMLGNVTGIDFNSSADLSKSMTLEDRITALVEGLGMQQSTLGEEDYIAIAELFLNSIDEKCFVSTDSKTTLTLEAGDVAAALKTFAGKLEENPELKTKLEAYINSSSGTTVDIIKELNDSADSIEKQDSADTKIVWEISFENEKPVSFEITASSGSEKYVLTFGYEKKGSGADISFKLDSGSTGVITGSFSYTKTGNKTEYKGDITFEGQSLTIEGSSESNGNKVSGTMTINIPEAGEISLDYEGTLSIGMPGKSVKDDSRFKIDTDSATVTSLPSGISGMPSM